MSSATALKFREDAKQLAAKRLSDRKRSLLVLILRHLADSGYIQACKKLESEANVTLDQADAAQNVDLLSIVQDYEEQYEFKYGRKPQLIQRCSSLPKESNNAQQPALGNFVSGAAAARDRRARAANRRSTDSAIGGPPVNKTANSKEPPAVAATPQEDPDQAFGINGLSVQAIQQNAASDKHEAEGLEGLVEQRLLKPLPDLGTSELCELGAAISQDIYLGNARVAWEDVAGLEGAKQLLREALVMPLQFPQLFTGILTPWRGILLYGPPGTGKTLLARAVATECKTTFFNISASSVGSKWRGNSEKLIKVLFELARYHAPSTIFLDEVDALMAVRGGEGEHEASRRMKTEFLIQMDGLAQSSAHVFVLAATNLPWHLDSALLRRLEKRIHVDLPSQEARIRMFTNMLGDRGVDQPQLTFLSEHTPGHSGSDIASLCKDIAIRPVRRYLATAQQSSTAVATPGVVTEQDIQDALMASKPSALLNEAKYQQFSKQYGQSAN